MGQELTTQEQLLAAEIGVSEYVVKMTTPLQQGWLRLAQIRTQTFEKLQKYELEIQGLCKAGKESTALEVIQKNLREAKSKTAEGKECRLAFTNMLKEKIIDKAMEFENRNAALVEDLAQYEFTFREAANKKLKQEEDVNREKAEFRAHIRNEWYRIAAKYRSDLLKVVNNSYTTALHQKFPAAEIAEYKKSVAAFCKQVKRDAMAKFSALLLSQDEMMAIYSEERKYDAAPDLQSAIDGIEQRFAMYANDLANVKAAAERIQAEAEQQTNAIQQEVELERATNTLVASAGALTMTGGPNTSIKTKVEVVDENTQEWAILVVSAFLANLKVLAPYIKVKTWEKLNIGQMAKAIAQGKMEHDLKFPNLKFKEVKK